jgi:hypothetical protein
VTGATESTYFPTQNALQPTFGGVQDVFVTKLSVDGTALVYSTYGGGSGADTGAAIAVDGEGQAYVTGATASADLPILNALDPTLGGPQDAFVAKLTAEGTAVVYATYLGGSASEAGAGIAVDETGQVYVTGSTDSTDFPTLEALDTTLGGTRDVFVTQLNAGGTALVYSTYLGGGGSEAGADIAVAEGGQAYVIGSTDSTDFPVQSAFQPTFGGGISDAFVTHLSGPAPITVQGFGCPWRTDICHNYCKSIRYRGGYCRGFLRQRCTCYR